MSNNLVHPSAVVENGAQISSGVSIGPFCYIGPNVKLCERVQIKSHSVITGKTEIGDDTVVHSFAVIGEIPQDLKFNGEETRLVIGKRNRIREHVTINTEPLGVRYYIGGKRLLFMTGSHIAHDELLEIELL